MPTFNARGTELYFEQHGSRSDVPVVLVHGIGCQLVQWPPALIDALTAHSLRVITLDNRDVGLSAQLDDLGTPDVMALMGAMASGDPVTPPYTIGDMADDVAGLLDHLGQMTAHIIGVSMGGMIAQQFALRHAARTLSLTSIMSSSGAADLPPPSPDAAMALAAAPASTSRDDLIAASQQTWNLIGGPTYPSVEVGMGQYAAQAIDRGNYPNGFARQLAAIVGDSARAEQLSQITAPTLVVHGDVDPLVPPAAGADTAKRIPGAQLVTFPDMGHDLPAPLLDDIAGTICTHIAAAPVSR